MNKILFSLTTILFFGSGLWAQSLERSVVASAGASVQAGNIVLDYTVGETVVATIGNGNLVLTQGFHQGELMTTDLRGLPAQAAYKVFPNPTGDELWMTMEGPELDYRVAIFNNAGQPVQGAERQVKASGFWQGQFDVSKLASGAYFVVILDSRGEWLKSHKVIKK